MIKYVLGDATDPIIKKGIRVIPHVVNNEGKWGKGFVTSISRRWKEPEKIYRKAAKNSRVFGLGYVQWCFVTETIAVCNMVAQKGLASFVNIRPLQYDHLEVCLDKMAKGARHSAEQSNPSQRLSIHMPRIGAGLAKGDWNIIEELIEETCWDLQVYVYDRS